MPNFRCKKCGSLNQVLPEALLFTCKACGEVQDTPAPEERIESSACNQMYFEPKTQDDIDVYTAPPSAQSTADEAEAPESMDAARKNGIYYTALSKIGGEDIQRYHEAIGMLQSLRGWRDADALIEQCEAKIDALTREKTDKGHHAKKRNKRRKLIVFITVPAVVLLIGTVLVSYFLLMPNKSYQTALSLAQSGQVVEAYEAFHALGAYKDSAQRAAALFDEYKKEKIQVAAIGDTVYLGTYRQNSSADSKKEDIAWQVLDKRGDTLLVLSVSGLDSVFYQPESSATTWESSYLRKWLNRDFYQSAFTAAQRQQILVTTVRADKNPDYDTDPGNDTRDKIFILSLSEVAQYLPHDKERIVKSTLYADTKGVVHNTENDAAGTASWFLRTPGMDQSMICYVQREGVVRRMGCDVSSAGSATRPAMWVKTTPGDTKS